MSFGKPVVAWDAAGARDVVVPETGVMVSGRDELRDALATLLADPGRAAALGSAGRRRVDDVFSFDRFASRTFDVLREAVGAR